MGGTCSRNQTVADESENLKSLEEKIKSLEKALEIQKKESDEALEILKKESDEKIALLEKQKKESDELAEQHEQEIQRRRLVWEGSNFATVDTVFGWIPRSFEGAEDKIKQHQLVEKPWFENPQKDQKMNKADFPALAMLPGADEEKISMAHIGPDDRTCSILWGPALLRLVFRWEKMYDRMEQNCFTSSHLRHRLLGAPGVFPMKQHFMNYLKLPLNHAQYFDHMSKGKIVIFPLWNSGLDKWTPKTPYELVVLADSPESYLWLTGPSADRLDDKPWIIEGDAKELEKPTEMLALMMMALAEQLVSEEAGNIFKRIEDMRDNDHEALLQLFSTPAGSAPAGSRDAGTRKSKNSKSPMEKAAESVNDFLVKFESLREVRQSLSLVDEKTQTRKGVSVPSVLDKVLAKDSQAKEPLKILKIDLGVYFKGKEHLIPDPMWILLRAAINCSAMTGPGKLLPTCKSFKEEEEEELQSLSAISWMTESQGPNVRIYQSGDEATAVSELSFDESYLLDDGEEDGDEWESASAITHMGA